MKSTRSIFLLGLALAGCSPVLERAGESLADLASGANDLHVGEMVSPLESRTAGVLDEGLHGRRLNSEVNAAWQIMHGVISYGTELRIDTPDRGYIGALDYAFSGGAMMGFELQPGSEVLPKTGRHGVKARLEPGGYIGQGHVDQWLAIFAMCDLPLDTPLDVKGEKFTVLDWARQAQFDSGNNVLDEYSWTLIALTHYFPDEPTWQVASGDFLSWESLVEAELTYDIDQSPCGGTHRLAGLVRAVNAQHALGLADSPTWERARQVIAESMAKAKDFSGRNGALSSYYFRRAGSTADLSTVLASSGHVLEFVALAAEPDELGAPWVESAVVQICEVLESTRDAELDCGALYHALNGLKIYQQRRFH